MGLLVLQPRQWHLRRHHYRFGCDAERRHRRRADHGCDRSVCSHAAHAYSVLALHDPEDSREADFSIPIEEAVSWCPFRHH